MPITTNEIARNGIAPPEPDLTPATLLARADAIAAGLVERQAETEQRTCFAPDTHESFTSSGLYRTLVPRMFGGYEFDLRTFSDVVVRIARGCPSTAWGFCLSAHHAVQLAAYWPESAQRTAFGDGHFVAASVAAPSGSIRRVADGWRIDGVHKYASGSPYSTHYMGQALHVEGESGTPSGPPTLFIAPRSTWELRDDWGRTLGLKGSGSNSVSFSGGIIPDDHALPHVVLTDVDVTQGTEGYRLHGNPLYAGRARGFFAVDFAALTVGMAWGALDEYERLLQTRKTARPPIVLRAENAHYQRWAGKARAQIVSASALVAEAAERYMKACNDGVTGERPFTALVELEIQAMGRQAMTLAWTAMQETLFRTAGSSAAEDGQRLQRIWRDMSMAWGHAFSSTTDLDEEGLGRAALIG